MTELSVNMTVSPYFDATESYSDAGFAKFVNPRVLLGKQLEIEAKNAESEQKYRHEKASTLVEFSILNNGNDLSISKSNYHVNGDT